MINHSIGVSIVDFKDIYNNIPLHYAIFFKNKYAIDIIIKKQFQFKYNR